MAETYGVLDFYALPVQLAATLAVGLRDDARIKLKMSGMKMSFQKYIITALFDKVNWLCWTKTKDAMHGINMPPKILDLLLQTELAEESDNDSLMKFDSPETFETARKMILGEEKNG